jgi:ribose transport system permease protein
MTIDTLAAEVSEAEAKQFRRRRWPVAGSAAVITLGLFLLSWLIAPGSVTRSALGPLLAYAGILAIAAVGQTIVVMLRGIDMSVPGMMTLGAIVLCKFAADHDDNLMAALLVVLVIALVVGVVNGLIITVFNVTPLVATLAINAALVGAAMAYSGGTLSRAPEAVATFSAETTLGLPNTVWLAIVIVLVAAVATSRTTWGRRVVAVGSNERAAYAAGIRVDLVKISVYAVAATCFALAGVVLAGYIQSPALTAGDEFLLPSIAAVVVGGTALSGGRGTVVGSAIGAVFLTQLSQLVLSLGAPPSTQRILEAVVIAVAVVTQRVDLKGLWNQMRGSSRTSA